MIFLKGLRIQKIYMTCLYTFLTQKVKILPQCRGNYACTNLAKRAQAYIRKIPGKYQQGAQAQDHVTHHVTVTLQIT